MLIAILIFLGIPIWFVIVLIGVAIMRRRWVKSRPGAFPCAARVASGRLDLIGDAWKRGFGRWERDVFIFAKVPSLHSFAAVAVDSLSATDVRPARPKEVRFMGDSLVVVPFVVASGARLELAVKPEYLPLVAGPFEPPAVPAGVVLSVPTPSPA
jgi:hypothetical protein